MSLLYVAKEARHPALLARRGRSVVELITLVGTRKKRLSTVRLTEQELAAQWFAVPDYPDAKAIKKFVEVAKERGYTKRVQLLLIDLINNLQSENYE